MEKLPKEEKINTSSKIDELPDYLIENYIFPYLTSKELFFIVRAVSPIWHESMKNAWGTNIKEEMFNQIKSLSFIYEKDEITKAYEYKYQYLVNYRNLLSIYHLNANILIVINDCLQFYENEEILKMIKLFFKCVHLENCNEQLTGEEEDIQLFSYYIISEESHQIFNEKINQILDLENYYEDNNKLEMLSDEFNLINKDEVEGTSENCKLIYSFVQGLIEFQALKVNVRELKIRVENLFLKIQNETLLWPKRKKFFETAYRFLLFSKSVNPLIKKMLKIMNKYKIKTPLDEYKSEAFKLMVNLKEKVVILKEEILASGQNPTEEESKKNQEKVENLFLDNILERRMLLTKKFIILEKFFFMHKNALEEFESNHHIEELVKNDSDEVMLSLNNEHISEKNFIVTMIIASQSYGDQFDENLLYKVSKIIKEKYNFEIKQLFYSEIDLEKQKEIKSLKEQKEHLLKQKQQTEQVLQILQKYLFLKENLTNNKKKYKIILYLLSKIRKGEAAGLDENSFINELNSLNLENFDIDLENISEAEKEELKNFETSDSLLKEIEQSLTKQINSFFNEEELAEIHQINQIEYEKLNDAQKSQEAQKNEKNEESCNLDIVNNSENIEKTQESNEKNDKSDQ